MTNKSNKMDRRFYYSLIFISPAVLIYISILIITNGKIIYTLDDPYIHLELAKNIWKGAYGINQNELSAPSSSILWPFILSPFSSFEWIYDKVPLIINIFCLVLSGLIISETFKDLDKIPATAFIMTLMISTNFYGLVFTGMEHSLQVLLVTIISSRISSQKHEGDGLLTDKVFYLSLFILPLIRYEGLAISLPVLAYALVRGNKKYALISLSCLLASIISFSLFLYLNKLGILPSSVLAKTNSNSIQGIIRNIYSNIFSYWFLLIPASIISIKNFSSNKAYSLMIISSTCLHFIFGKHGWYGRYEVYYIVFILIITFRHLLDITKNNWKIIFIIPPIFSSLIYPTITTPLAASNILNQQYQMASIARSLNAPIAVNDLGLVSLRSEKYILDLYGLGSIEALKNRKNNNEITWISRLMLKNNVHYAIIYDDWFPKKPSNWEKVAELRLLEIKITPASDTVSFYATSHESAEKMKSVLKEFEKSNKSEKFKLIFYI